MPRSECHTHTQSHICTNKRIACIRISIVVSINLFVNQPFEYIQCNDNVDVTHFWSGKYLAVVCNANYTWNACTKGKRRKFICVVTTTMGRRRHFVVADRSRRRVSFCAFNSLIFCFRPMFSIPNWGWFIWCNVHDVCESSCPCIHCSICNWIGRSDMNPFIGRDVHNAYEKPNIHLCLYLISRSALFSTPIFYFYNKSLFHFNRDERAPAATVNAHLHSWYVYHIRKGMFAQHVRSIIITTHRFCVVFFFVQFSSQNKMCHIQVKKETDDIRTSYKWNNRWRLFNLKPASLLLEIY